MVLSPLEHLVRDSSLHLPCKTNFIQIFASRGIHPGIPGIWQGRKWLYRCWRAEIRSNPAWGEDVRRGSRWTAKRRSDRGVSVQIHPCFQPTTDAWTNLVMEMLTTSRLYALFSVNDCDLSTLRLLLRSCSYLWNTLPDYIIHELRKLLML